jgi:hypothetical protein
MLPMSYTILSLLLKRISARGTVTIPGAIALTWWAFALRHPVDRRTRQNDVEHVPTALRAVNRCKEWEQRISIWK